MKLFRLTRIVWAFARDYTLGAAGGALVLAFVAVALLASGQSSTITGTLAGQVVMEGFTRIRIAPWKRRMITRLLGPKPSWVLPLTGLPWPDCQLTSSVALPVVLVIVPLRPG